MSIHIARNSCQGLEYRLIVQHDAHIAEQRYCRLLIAHYVFAEVGRYINYSPRLLSAYHLFGILHIDATACHIYVRRSIKHANKFSAFVAVAVVDNSYRHFSCILCAVYPGVEQRIEQWYKDEEHQHSLILERMPKFLYAYLASVLYYLFYHFSFFIYLALWHIHPFVHSLLYAWHKSYRQ